MTRITFLLLACSAFLLTCCKPEAGKKEAGQEMPANASMIPVEITQLNCWKERGNFYVTGICNSQSDQWQKIWLRMAPRDSTGKPLFYSGEAGIVFPVFSAAVPPRGRSAFFQGWSLKNFSKIPDTCRVVCAGAITTEPGPILLVEGLSGVRMLAPVNPDSDTSAHKEQGWQISADLSNPLQMKAEQPCLELLVYGKDNRLWFANMIKLSDPRLGQVVQMEGKGPILPGTKRHFGTQVSYGRLPRELNKQKIGKVEIFAFEER